MIYVAYEIAIRQIHRHPNFSNKKNYLSLLERHRLFLAMLEKRALKLLFRSECHFDVFCKQKTSK